MAWVKVDDQFTGHPKMARVGPLGIAMQVAALCHCSRYLTDGFIANAVPPLLLNFDGVAVGDWRPESEQVNGVRADWRSVVEALVAAGAWEPTDGGWVLHDYLAYNPSRAQVLAGRAKDTERKSRGRRPDSEDATGGIRAESGRNPGGIRRSPSPSPSPSGERDPDVSGANAPSTSSSAVAAAPPTRRRAAGGREKPAPTLVDLELARLLARRIRANNPTAKITEAQGRKWADEARLMRERDDRTPAEIAEHIEWTQKDPFWRANCLSMASIREHWDKHTLRMKPGGDGGGDGLPRLDTPERRREVGL